MKKNLCIFLIFFVLLVCILGILKFFCISVSFDKKTKDEKEYQVRYLNFSNKYLAKHKENISKIINKKCKDICIITSNKEFDFTPDKTYFSYQQSLTRNLIILSKFKLGFNKTKFLEPFLVPAYTGYIYFNDKKILFSYLPRYNKKNIKNEKYYRKIMLRRVSNHFRHRKMPILFLTHWDLNIFNKKKFLRYLYVEYLGHNFDFLRHKKNAQIYKSKKIKVYGSKITKYSEIIKFGW